MKWFVFVLLMVVCLMIVMCYALMVMAHNADERADRMYRAWKEQLETDIRENGEALDSDYNVGIDHAMCVLGAMKGADDER